MDRIKPIQRANQKERTLDKERVTNKDRSKYEERATPVERTKPAKRLARKEHMKKEHMKKKPKCKMRCKQVPEYSDGCKAKDRPFACTLPNKHRGPHIACGETSHNFHYWK